MSDPLIVRRLGCRPYRPVWEEMQAYTEGRDATSADEVWLVEHPPVFTLGRNSRPEHLLAPGEIPVVQVDRGGQVTYHGPGQVVAYLLVDLRRRGEGVRWLVGVMERAVVGLLAAGGVTAATRHDAPGVYVDGAKVASLGLRVRRGCSYHGLALNVAMDLEPFGRINPCGYRGMAVTQLRDLGLETDLDAVGSALVARLAEEMGAGVRGEE